MCDSRILASASADLVQYIGPKVPRYLGTVQYHGIFSPLRQNYCNKHRNGTAEKVKQEAREDSTEITLKTGAMVEMFLVLDISSDYYCL
jgi:hypothetical protein